MSSYFLIICFIIIVFFSFLSFLKYLDFLKFKKNIEKKRELFDKKIESLNEEIKKYENDIKIYSYVCKTLTFDFSSNKELKYNNLENLFNLFINPKINENDFFKYNICLECLEINDEYFNKKLMEDNVCSICNNQKLTINPFIYKSLLNNNHLFDNNYELLNGYNLTFKTLN